MITFNPGPSKLVPGVASDLSEIATSGLLSASHRSAEVKSVVLEAIAATRTALRIPEDYAVVLQPSATAAMELVVRNLAASASTHFVGGAFGERFAATAEAVGVRAHRVEHAWSEAPDLSSPIPEGTELVTVTHNETSTGMRWPEVALQALGTRLEREHPEALLAIDATSSLGGVELDFRKADIWLASVQKALGLPAGLALVIAGPRAVERAGRAGAADEAEGGRGAGEAGGGGRAGSAGVTAHTPSRPTVVPWQSLTLLAEKIETGQTFETPNVLGIALLARRMARLNLSEAAERCRGLAEQVATAGSSGQIDFEWFVEDADWRSPTVQNLVVDDPAACIARARDAGYLLGGGYGKLTGRCIRLATFPAHEPEELAGLLGALGADSTLPR